ncbi:unnamed protein product, partial [Lymnaea stagnalis]
LLEANDEVALELLPVMLFLGLLSILGVVGNGFVCFIFTRKFSKNSQNLLIVLLAVFDLHTCVLTIPYEIIDLRFYVYYIFDTDVICKVFKFVNTFCNAGSILVLLVIAVDRYRKVCKPLNSQLQLQSIRITFILIFVISACYSIPIFFLYGYRTIQSNIIHGAKSRDCSTPDGIDTLYPTVFNGVLFLTFVIISIALIIMYSKILAEVKRRNKHKKRNRPYRISYGDTNNISQGSDDDQTIKEVTHAISILNGTSTQNCADVKMLGAANLGNTENETPIIDENQHFLSRGALAELDSNNNKSASKYIPGMASCLPNTTVRDYLAGQTLVQAGERSASSRKRRRARQQTTLVAFSVTSVFVLSFLPHLTLMIAKLVIFPGFDLDLRGAAFVAYNVFVRSYFVNSMCNPFIYGILNAQFRLEVQRILRSVCCRA